MGRMLHIRKFLKNISLSIIAVVLFFGGLELAQRIRYSHRNSSASYLFFGTSIKGKSYTKDAKKENVTARLIDTFSEIPSNDFLRETTNPLQRYTKYAPGFYWREYRGKKFLVHINKHGFRGPEIEEGKPDDLLRIIIVGGSSIAGLESPDSSTLTYTLQGLISESSFLPDIKKRKIEVINAGQGGQLTHNAVKLVSEDIVYLKPDILMVYSAFNDHNNRVFSIGKIFYSSFARRALGKTWLWLYNHSLLFATAYEKFYLYPEWQPSMRIAEEEVFAQYEENITALIEIARKSGIKPVLIKQPLFLENFSTRLQNSQEMKKLEEEIKNGVRLSRGKIYYWAHSRQLQILDDLARRYNTLIIDPIPEFDQNDKKILFHDIVHLTEDGNKLLAQIIFRELSRMKAEHLI